MRHIMYGICASKLRNLYINLFDWYIVKMKMFYEYSIVKLSISIIEFSD
jgi:hypothetical protein